MKKIEALRAVLDPLLPSFKESDGYLRRCTRMMAGGALLSFVFIGILLIYSLFLFVRSAVRTDDVSELAYPQFRIDSAAVFELETTDYDLSATWNFTLVASYPNYGKLAIFDRVRAFVYYCPKDYMYFGDKYEYSLAKKQLPPFFMYGGNETRLDFRVGVIGAPVSPDEAKQISVGKTVVGSVKFGLMLMTPRKNTTDDTNGFIRFCDPIEFIFSSPTNNTGVFTGQSRACNFD
ncbi:hypothetical protein RchiOBHm_Chr3g0471371 [Rosa chinensis]|uniref:Late embryogenesis abundant protein, LEA-14 n=1 Tax=Rosa chinensis TaxID=74649 RepID=A0A2P6RBB2_ROSCH|nr:hypothetical protein RchiOBHm_Chr3g0471371 [Rosa chinensis]